MSKPFSALKRSGGEPRDVILTDIWVSRFVALRDWRFARYELGLLGVEKSLHQVILHCFTPVGWTLDIIHFRAFKQPVALTEIALDSKEEKKYLGCRNVVFQWRDRSNVSKRIYFVSSRVVNAQAIHASSHLYTKKGCQRAESRALDKRKSLISITDCIQSAGSINHMKSR